MSSPTDGRFFSGVVKRESPKEIVLKDPLRDEIVIAATDIEEKRIGGSLMPDGLDQSLTDAELADLFRFLAELGKPGPVWRLPPGLRAALADPQCGAGQFERPR